MTTLPMWLKHTLTVIAMMAAITLAGLAHGACPPAGQCSVPGRGAIASECLVEYTGITLNEPPAAPTKVRCADGDPSCDADGVHNGLCTFRISACINNPDTRFAPCPTGLGAINSFTVQNKLISNPKYDTGLGAIQNAVNALLPSSTPACTASQLVTVPLKIKRGVYKRGKKKLKSTATSVNGGLDKDGVALLCDPCPTATTPTGPRATVIANASQLVGGPLARGQLGDILLSNENIRVVIQKPGRVMFGIGTYGGNIIDADRNRCGAPDRDSFEEMAVGINLENTANYTSVTVLNDGTNGLPAVVRATGPDDLLDFVNPSSVVAGLGFTYPPQFDDQNYPIDVQTDYVLEPGKSYVKVLTTLTNTGASPQDLYVSEFLNGSGQVELFQSGFGFGEPTITDPCQGTVACTAGSCDPCDYVAYSGEDDADGVSYGYIHGENGSSSFTTSGVTVPVLSRRVGLVLVGFQGPNPAYQLAATGNPGAAKTFTRYFAVGDGSVASLLDMRNSIYGFTKGTLAGSVTAGGAPLANADVAVIGSTSDGPPGAAPSGAGKNVVDHFRTDATGFYSGTLPPGSYTVRANKDGRLFGTPDPVSVTITANATTTQNFDLPAAGKLRVQVVDESNQPIPAKVQLVGFDPSPDPLNKYTVIIINTTTGVFGEQAEDGLVYGIANVNFADKTGDTGTVEVEPGTYQLVVSRGPRYSASKQLVTITAGATTNVNAQIAKVVDTPGFIGADFHVHAINSPDSEVTFAERIATMLAEGMDFFTPSDHDYRSDYGPTLTAMGVTNLVSVAQSAEITTFDYGHYNAWPMTHDGSQVNGGGVDWGRAGIAPGHDFPGAPDFSFNLTPAEIYTAAHADPANKIIQINHVASFFGPDGLDIDTAELGTGPPQSHTPGAARRLDPGITNYFDTGFDALEIWIGTDGRSGDLNTFLGLNIGDWFNLLNQGILKPGIADSDTHQRRTTQLNARNWIASAVTDPGLLGPEAANLAQNILDGHSFGSNAPFLTITANAPSCLSVLCLAGDTAGLALAQDNMLGTLDGTVNLTVTVKSPLWAEFDSVQYYVNNAPQAYDNDANAGTRNRYRVIPNVTHSVTPTVIDDFPSIPDAKHLEVTDTLSLTGVAADSWVVVVVRGTDGVSHPLFPVLPNSLQASGNTTLGDLTDGNLNQQGVLALSFTNPLYIDANNDGTWTPPGVTLTP